MLSVYSNKVNKAFAADPEPKPQNSGALFDWVEEIQTSMWATRDEAGHAKVTSGY